MAPKFLVVRVYEHCDPSVVETLDIENDAKALAQIMHRKEPEYQFAVYKAL